MARDVVPHVDGRHSDLVREIRPCTMKVGVVVDCGTAHTVLSPKLALCPQRIHAVAVSYSHVL